MKPITETNWAIIVDTLHIKAVILTETNSKLNWIKLHISGYYLHGSSTLLLPLLLLTLLYALFGLPYRETMKDFVIVPLKPKGILFRAGVDGI